jgi:hypothetical protein
LTFQLVGAEMRLQLIVEDAMVEMVEQVRAADDA